MIIDNNDKKNEDDDNNSNNDNNNNNNNNNDSAAFDAVGGVHVVHYKATAVLASSLQSKNDSNPSVVF